MAFTPPADPGELRHEATFATFNSPGFDDDGQPTGQWDTVYTAKVKVEGLSARTVEVAHQLYDEATHIVFCRYAKCLARGMRITTAGRTFTIGAVDNWLERNIWQRLMVREEWPNA